MWVPATFGYVVVDACVDSYLGSKMDGSAAGWQYKWLASQCPTVQSGIARWKGQRMPDVSPSWAPISQSSFVFYCLLLVILWR